MSGIHLYFIDKWRLKCEQGNTLFLRGKAINQNHISKTNIIREKNEIVEKIIKEADIFLKTANKLTSE